MHSRNRQCGGMGHGRMLAPMDDTDNVSFGNTNHQNRGNGQGRGRNVHGKADISSHMPLGQCAGVGHGPRNGAGCGQQNGDVRRRRDGSCLTENDLSAMSATPHTDADANTDIGSAPGAGMGQRAPQGRRAGRGMGQRYGVKS